MQQRRRGARRKINKISSFLALASSKAFAFRFRLFESWRRPGIRLSGIGMKRIKTSSQRDLTWAAELSGLSYCSALFVFLLSRVVETWVARTQGCVIWTWFVAVLLMFLSHFFASRSWWNWVQTSKRVSNQIEKKKRKELRYTNTLLCFQSCWLGFGR